MGELRRRGPYARTKERRAAIADAALALVIERGHRALTTLEVANRAGISEPGLLYHYPSKEALLVAALALFDERELSLLQPGEALETAPAHATAGVQRTNIVGLYAALQADASDPKHPAHDYFIERFRVSRDNIARDIAILKERGEVHPRLEPQKVATWVIAAWDGLQSHWLVEPSFDIGAELAALIDAILQPASFHDPIGGR